MGERGNDYHSETEVNNDILKNEYREYYKLEVTDVTDTSCKNFKEMLLQGMKKPNTGHNN